MVQKFLRKAALTPFIEKPDYQGFKEIAMRIFRHVGLDRTLTRMNDSFFDNILKSFLKEKVSVCRQEIIKNKEKL